MATACAPPPAEEAEPKPEEGAEVAAPASIEEQEAAVPENPMKDAYFGETHVHTSYSLDAYIAGARLTPDDAYRFAKGETVTLHGQPHDIVKPLDFAAVTDHALKRSRTISRRGHRSSPVDAPANERSCR